MARVEYPLPLSLTLAYSMREPKPIPRGNPTWRATGNLRGDVPVKDDSAPPNLSVIEDEELFLGLHRWANNLAFEQRQLADELAGNPDDLPDDNRYWFAESYARVSAELIAAVDAREFYYPSYVLLSVVYFDAVYRDNFRAFATTGVCEPHWQLAFTLALGDWVRGFRDSLPSNVADAALGLFNLGRSAHAHLRFDLCRALSWMCENHYPRALAGTGVVELGDFEGDFFNMGMVFDRVTDQVKDVIGTRTGAPVGSIPNFIPGLDGWVNVNELGTSLAFGLGLAEERQRTWARAVELHRGLYPNAFLCELEHHGSLGIPRLLGSLTEGVNTLTGEPMEFTSSLASLADPPTMVLPVATQAAIDQLLEL